MSEIEKAALVHLSLGTNLGKRRVNLEQAVGHLASKINVQKISSIFQTAPWGVEDQPDFFNICLVAETLLSPTSLLANIKLIETKMGRETGPRWGPRLIDIDILFYNDFIIRTERLTVPHPQMARRAFVLAPLAEIAPDFSHPQLGLTVAQLLSQVDSTGVERLSEMKVEKL